MYKIIVVKILILLSLGVIFSCTQKSDEATDKVPLETKKAEMQDSTRLDPAENSFDSTYTDSYGGK